jgi:hypothetical protein
MSPPKSTIMSIFILAFKIILFFKFPLYLTKDYTGSVHFSSLVSVSYGFHNK